MALVLTPVANLAVVRDNVGGMDTSVQVDSVTPGGAAGPEDILEGHGAYVNGQLIKGTMLNNSEKTIKVDDVIDNNDGTCNIKIPENGYYTKNSYLQIPIKEVTKGSFAIFEGSAYNTAYTNSNMVYATGVFTKLNDTSIIVNEDCTAKICLGAYGSANGNMNEIDISGVKTSEINVVHQSYTATLNLSKGDIIKISHRVGSYDYGTPSKGYGYIYVE